MFKKKVVFVVGAGASKEYGLPLGSELKDRIAEAVRFRFEYGHRMVKGSAELLDHIRRHTQGHPDLHNRVNQYTRAGNLLADAISSFVSVDEALHYVSESSEAIEVGKIAIIHEIVEAERNSSLAYDSSSGKLAQLPQGWLAELFSMALAGTRRDGLSGAFNNVSFVNFNYDRVIEQYLFWALQLSGSASAEDAKEIVDNLNMIRPYGSVGQFAINRHDQFGFGTSTSFDPFLRLSALGTYTDQKPLHDLAAMQNAIGNAELIIFLGFGFHSSNLELIKRINSTNQTTHVFGTVKGIHQSNHPVIESQIRSRLNSGNISVELRDMFANELLRELRPKIQMLSG